MDVELAGGILAVDRDLHAGLVQIDVLGCLDEIVAQLVGGQFLGEVLREFAVHGDGERVALHERLRIVGHGVGPCRISGL